MNISTSLQVISSALLLCFGTLAPQESESSTSSINISDGCGSTLDPTAVALQTEGWGMVSDGKLTPEAQSKLEKAIKLEPNLIGAYLGLSQIYAKATPDPRKAIEILEKAPKKCPQAAVIYVILGDIYYGNKMYSKALENYSIAIEKGENVTPALYYNRGQANMSLGNSSAAIADYRSAIAIDSRKLDARRQLVGALFRSGDKNGALKAAEELAGIDPNGEDGQWAKGAIQRLKGN